METKVYRYGLLAPTLGAEIVSEQMRSAHRYQNALVEIERSRRSAVRAVLGAHGDMAAPEAALAALISELECRRAAAKARRAETRSRDVAPEEREAMLDLRARLREARATIKAAKAKLRDDAAVQADLAAVNAAHHARAIAARAACGVYWGTYLLAEQAVDAARRGVMDPRFQRWTGDGSVAVQIQGGMSIADALSGDDTRLRLDMHAAPAPGRGGRPLPRLRLRVGSDCREPVWAEWPMIYHRPLPDNARIKWAKVVLRLGAAREQWSLHLTIETATPRDAPQSALSIAVDLGWRREADTLRAAGWADSAGDSGEVLLDPAVRGMLCKAEDLRSIRDRSMNELRAALTAWRDSSEGLPQEHVERMAFMPQWRSPARFAALILWWREHRTAGDHDIYSRAEAWRKHDKHLWQWEANARRKALARRRDQYRVFAARAAEKYGTLVIERLRLDALAEIPAPESARESNPSARAQRVETAPSELRVALMHAFQARGRRVFEVPAGKPAEKHLFEFERSGGKEIVRVARPSRFSKLRPGAAAAELSSGA